MKNILQIALFLVSLLGLVACGGGGDIVVPVVPTDDKISTVTLKIDKDCIADQTIEALATYVVLKSGDTIVRDGTNTKIEMYHSDDGTKVVCLVNGSAHIVRVVGE